MIIKMFSQSNNNMMQIYYIFSAWGNTRRLGRCKEQQQNSMSIYIYTYISLNIFSIYIYIYIYIYYKVPCFIILLQNFIFWLWLMTSRINPFIISISHLCLWIIIIKRKLIHYSLVKLCNRICELNVITTIKYEMGMQALPS